MNENFTFTFWFMKLENNKKYEIKVLGLDEEFVFNEYKLRLKYFQKYDERAF